MKKKKLSFFLNFKNITCNKLAIKQRIQPII